MAYLSHRCPWIWSLVFGSAMIVVQARSECFLNSSLIKEEDSCLAWHYINLTRPSNCSEFGESYEDIIKRHTTNTSSMYAIVLLGYCMTYDDGTYLMQCPYDVVGGKEHIESLYKQTSLLMNTTLGNLTNFTCAHLNREGRHCSKCSSGYGPSVFNMDFGCRRCDVPYSGWGVYLVFELVPLTIFLILILVLQVSPTKPSMKAFVLYSQLTTMFLSFAYEQPYKYTFGVKTSILVNIVKSFYGFWNLDFFRSLLPPFCLDESFNNLEAIAFQYISIIYPTILVILAWIIVELHEKGCRPIVRMWKPFRMCLSHYSVTTNPKSTIVTFYATVITLSYTKVVFISGSLLYLVMEYRVCEGNNSKVLFLQPDIVAFSGQHTPFVILSAVMLITFAIVPLLILVLYPIKHFQDMLKGFCVRHNNIQMFAKAFYGCYKDGTDNTRDCTLFSTLYLLLRILLVVIFTKTPKPIVTYILAAAVHGLLIGLFLGFRPYKQEAYNYLDASFFFAYGTGLLFAAFAPNNSNDDTITKIIFCFIFFVMVTPLIYASLRGIVFLVKLLKLIDIRAFIQKRRRGYVEIGEYGIEPDSISDAVQHHEQARNRRERE